MAARLVLDVNQSPEPFVCFVSALGVKEAGGPLVLVVPYTFDHPHRRLIFVKVSSLEDLAAEPFLDRGIRKLATDRGYALPFDVGLEHALGCNTPAAGADVDRRCCVAHSLRLALVPCLSLTGLTSSVHLGIPNLGGRWPGASDIFFMCFLLGCFTWAVRFRQTPSMCCTPRCIGMLWTCWIPSVPADLATSRHLGRRICVRRMFLLYREESVLPTPP